MELHHKTPAMPELIRCQRNGDEEQKDIEADEEDGSGGESFSHSFSDEWDEHRRPPKNVYYSGIRGGLEQDVRIRAFIVCGSAGRMVNAVSV